MPDEIGRQFMQVAMSPFLNPLLCVGEQSFLFAPVGRSVACSIKAALTPFHLSQIALTLGTRDAIGQGELCLDPDIAAEHGARVCGVCVRGVHEHLDIDTTWSDHDPGRSEARADALHRQHLTCVDFLDRRCGASKGPTLTVTTLKSGKAWCLPSLDPSKEGATRLVKVIEVAGDVSIVSEEMALLRPQSCYIFAGMVHPKTSLKITGEAIIRKCLTIYRIHPYHPMHLWPVIQFLERTAGTYP